MRALFKIGERGGYTVKFRGGRTSGVEDGGRVRASTESVGRRLRREHAGWSRDTVRRASFITGASEVRAAVGAAELRTRSWAR